MKKIMMKKTNTNIKRSNKNTAAKVLPSAILIKVVWIMAYTD